MRFAKTPPLQLPVFLTATLCCVVADSTAAQPPKKAAKNALTIVDNSGKEHKLATWQFTAGTRRLSWLPFSEKPTGLEVLEFSEGTKTPLRVRVVNLIPLRSIRSLEYDHKKQTVTVLVAAKDKDLKLTGQTGYVGVNVIDIDAESDLGELGKAKVRFRGGVQRGIRSIRFPSPQPVDALPKGLVSKVVAADRAKTGHEAVDLQAVWSRADRSVFPDKSLQFEKTIRVDLNKIQKMSRVGGGAAKRGLVFDVTLKSGLQKPLILVERRLSEKKRTEFLLGLIGRVEAGYKLFPMQTIGSLSHAE